jgi:hypothetical protein
MNAIRTTYEDLPELVKMPKDFVHRKAEIIIIIEDKLRKNKKSLREFFGIIPDFPERFSQGGYEERESLH